MKSLHIENFNTQKYIKETKIAVLSDFHYCHNYNLKIFHKLEKQIIKNKPNYICIVGDILDENSYDNLDDLINFFTNIAKVSPLIISLGNHDQKKGSFLHWQSEDNNNFINKLKEIPNTHLLQDSTWQSNNITFYGFNLSFDYYEKQHEPYEKFVEELKNLKTKLNDTTYNILLLHSPINIYKFLEQNPQHNLNKTDLILSGHMHNGLLPLIISKPINKIFKTNRSFAAPNRTLFPNYAQGRVYKIKDGYIYEGVKKFSNSTGFFKYFDFIYPKNISLLTIKKENSK